MKKDTNNQPAPALSQDIVDALKEHLPAHKSQADFSRVLGVSPTQLSRALSGAEFNYNVAEFESRVRHYLGSFGNVRADDDAPETTGFLVEAMANFLDTARLTKDVGVTWSNAGYGKSLGIRVYQASNPLCIVVTARKSLCGWRAVRDAILAALPQRRRLGGESWDAFILRTFSGSGRLLIIDNAHLLTESARQWLAYDWHDCTGCPLALVGNPQIKGQWAGNDQHQSRVGLSYEVAPQDTATDTARTMLRLHLPEGEQDSQTVKLAAAIIKAKGGCRSLKKHLLLGKELLHSGNQNTPAAALKAANKLLLSAPDLNLEAA